MGSKSIKIVSKIYYDYIKKGFLMQYIFAVDLGGTTVKMGIFNEEGTLIKKWEIPTRRENGGAYILPDINESMMEHREAHRLSSADIMGIGIGVPGPVTAGGIVNKCVNLGWNVFNLTKTLKDMTGLPVRAGNDATLAALGETRMGGGKGYSNTVLVTLGTGVGGGIILNNQIVYGATGSAGEIGHICVNEQEEEACPCGNHGCLEQYASATGILHSYYKLSDAEKAASTLSELDTIAAKDIFDAAKMGDRIALKLVDQCCHYLGKALASIACVTNPEAIIIGGGVSRAGDILIEGIRPYYLQYAFHSLRTVDFKLATLGNDAGICGAASLFL